MKYQITSDNIEMSESMEILAKEKVSKLDHKLTHIRADTKSIRIVLNKAPNEMFAVKLLLTIRGKEYFTDETEYTLETALIRAVEELERMLEKDKIFTASQEWEEAREAKRLTEEDLLDNETVPEENVEDEVGEDKD